MESVAAVATPDSDAPRALRRRPGRMGLWQVLVVLFIPHVWIGVGLVFVAAAGVVFPFVAVPVQAHVEGKHTGHSKNGVTYNVELAYDFGGSGVHTSKGVSRAFYERAQPGDVVDVKAARIGGFDHAEMAGDQPLALFVFFAAFWNAIVGVFVYLLAVKPVLTWQLLRTGKRVPATVTSHHHVGGKGAHEAVVVAFNAATGEAVEQKLSVDTRSWKSSGLGQGSACVVFHHPSKPSRCAIYETVAWEIA